MGKIWFVVHKYDLWDVNNRIIGFWNKTINHDCILADDTVIYYRTEAKEIKGIFKVLFKGKDIDKFFSQQIAQKQHLHWQCVLALENMVEMCKIDMDKLGSRLSFYDDWVKHFHGGRDQQVFPATQDDIDLILNKR